MANVCILLVITEVEMLHFARYAGLTVKYVVWFSSLSENVKKYSFKSKIHGFVQFLVSKGYKINISTLNGNMLCSF